MKNILFSFIFVLLACPLLAQQQPNVLLPHHSLMPRYAYPEQNQKTALSGEMDFRLPSMPNTEITIRVDSIFFLDEEIYFKEVNTYDVNGKKLTALSQEWKNGEWVNVTLLSYTYNASGYVMTFLSQNWENGTWVNYLLGNYKYNANGNMLANLGQEWENNAWVNYRLYTYTYDTNGNRLTHLRQYWENSSWVNFWLDTYTYSANGNRMTSLIQDWENGAWVNNDLYTYTYNANGSILTDLKQDWENSAWVNYRLFTYTYNDNWDRLSDLFQNWENGAWVNEWLDTYTYDANGNIMTKLKQKCESGEWVNNQLRTYTYDANWNMLTDLFQYWSNGAWVNFHLYTNTYDSNENMLTELLQEWEIDSWVNDEKKEYVFFPGQVNATAYDWDGSNWIESSYNDFLEIIMGGEYLFYYYAINLELYYTDVTGIEEEDAWLDDSPIRCYPNPVTDQINIEIDPAWQAAHYLLELFGQTGQKVKSFEISSDFGSSALSLSVKDVPPGLYLLRVIAGKQIFSQKIIISR